MAYKNERTDRAKLHQAWVVEQDRPCRACDCHGSREIHRKTPGYLGGKYTRVNCEVLCFDCHRGAHPNSKFRTGDRVCINGRTPVYIELSRHTPRTIITIEYSRAKECNYYTLGSNGQGEAADGQPLEGIQYYKFRSYQLRRYTPRKYGRRRYRMKATDSRLMSKTSGLLPVANNSGH